jgi:hypothetical protein
MSSVKIKLITTEEYGAAETAIVIGKHVLGYVGHSAYADRTKELS